MTSQAFISSPAAKALNFVCACSVIAISSITASAQAQGVSAYGDICIKANLADFANAHGHANIGFNPAIYSIPDKPFTAKRVYTFRRIRPGELHTREQAVSSRSAAPDLSEEVVIARDKMGGVRYEAGGPARGDIVVMIYDPVPHTLSQYYLTADRGMPDNAVATVKRMQLMSKLSRPIAETSQVDGIDHSAESVLGKSESSPPGVGPSSKASAKSVPRIDPLPKDLPEQSIDGIRVIGYRMVHKYGDKNQYLQIQEDWLSPEYLVNLRNDIVRDSIGESTIETRDLVDGEPDAAFFQVPGGYLIQKEQ